jgi:hypothetical protein
LKLALGALVLGGCAVGAPTGFSTGDHWTAPLVGSLENGVLLVPVYVGQAGPYLFAIDPDAKVSIVDDKVVKEAGLRSGEGPRLDDELDHQNPHFFAEVLQLQVGTLTVQNKSALIVKTDAYDVDGRAVDGVLGRDVIADSLVFGFDRDAGLVTLLTQEAWKKQAPAAGDVPVHYDLLSDRNRTELVGSKNSHMGGGNGQDLDVLPVSRRLASAMIDGARYVVHLDFGAKASQLRERSWAAAKIEATPAQGMLIDETGTGRNIDKIGKAAEVTLGTLSVPNVVLAPYVDARWREQDIEGALGLDFWKPYTIWADWNAQTIHVVPRHEVDPRARIGRWQLRQFAACATPACITSTVIDPLAHLAPDAPRPAQNPGIVVSFARDRATANIPLEALVAVKGADGAEKERLIVSLPAKADRTMTHLPGEFAGATLTVLDISPFPRACPAEGGCVDVLAAAP